MSSRRRPLARAGDVAYYRHAGRRRTPVAYSTVATSRLLGLLHEDNPTLTIAELRDLIQYDSDAIAVCDAYIAAGEGDVVPNWRW